jgi:GNAT superfamily N-acetyltransferase
MFRIRELRPEDGPRLAALYARVQDPYLPEHARLVQEMHARARQAQARNDRWRPLPENAPAAADATHEAFWVALADQTAEQIVGTLGLRRVGDDNTAAVDTAEWCGLPTALDWVAHRRVGELRRMRVAPEWRRRGVASALLSAGHDYAASNGIEQLVLNTTSAQIPALQLYTKHGFRELTRTYLGSYELVWLARDVRSRQTLDR